MILDADWLSVLRVKMKPVLRNHGTSQKTSTVMMKLTKKGLRKVKHGYSDVDDNFVY